MSTDVKRPPLVVTAPTAVVGTRAPVVHPSSCNCAACANYHCGICFRTFPLDYFRAHMPACVLGFSNERRIKGLLRVQLDRGREDLARKADPAGRWR